MMNRPKWTDVGAAGCAAGFVLMLGLAAYWDPRIRLLHLVESVPYLAAGAMALRQVKFGYVLGVAGGGFWLWTGSFCTTFIRNGFERFVTLIGTGTLDGPDILIAVPAAISAAGLVLFCALSYALVARKSWVDAGLFLATLVLVAGFFVGIFAFFAPQYLRMFPWIFRT